MPRRWFGILTLLGVMLLLLLLLRWSNRLVNRERRRSLVPLPTIETFNPAAIADLPAPVQRYFLHAIQPQTPLATSVQLHMHGSFKLQRRWLPMQAEEILCTAGFLWQATIGTGLMQFRVVDHYGQRSGRVDVTLWGAIPLVAQQNPDITRATQGRLGIELIWLPAALLPQTGVQWTAMDDHTIAARFAIDDEPVHLTLAIAEDGKLLNVTMQRWGENKAAPGTFAYLPYGAEVRAEMTFGGFTIPSQIGVGWGFGTEQYEETFRATIDQATYC